MAWSDIAQRCCGILGANVEFGYATLASGTVEVATRLSKIEAALCCYAADPTRADPLRCDGTITAGAVTICCADPMGNEKVWYLFIGLP
jgi:hypothetical protein